MTCTHSGACYIGSRRVCPACLALASRTAVIRMDAHKASCENLSDVRRQRQSNVPETMRDVSFSSFVPPDLQAAETCDAMAAYCEQFADYRSQRPGFIFSGATATGKTLLACAIVNTLVSHGYRASYISMPDLGLAFRKGFRDDSESAADLVARMSSYDLLIIDDIDLHGTSDAEYQFLFDIIDHRFSAGSKPTLAITQRDEHALAADLGDRIVSRLLGEYGPVAFDWVSYYQARRIQL